MRVGFDISQLAHLGGVISYTNHLTEEFSKIPNLSMVYFYSSLRKPYKGHLKNVKSFKLPPTLFEVLFNNIRNVGIEKFIGPVDIFHSSDWVQPPTKAKKVTTYHDVIPLKFPEWSDPKIVSVHRRRLELVEREIDVVIAVSEATKRDLIDISKIREDKIKVVYEAAGEEFKRAGDEEIARFKRDNSLPDKFILAIGGIGTRRNLNRVKEIGRDHPLVITGETIKPLPDNQMPLLYSSAELLLYPSFYEGFGLPILEAFSCGTPVITSNISSMPEIGGEAALYIDPENTDQIREKVGEVLNDKDLRGEMIKKGLARAGEFSWERAARETAEIYQELMV